jgi:hypothetical protein
MCITCKSLVLPRFETCQREECDKGRMMEFCDACLLPLPRSATRCPNADCPRPDPVQRTRYLRVVCFSPSQASGLAPLKVRDTP